jgi:hypothetical protein
MKSSVRHSGAIHKHFIRTLQKTHCFFITKTNRLILLREIVAVYYDNHAADVTTFTQRKELARKQSLCLVCRCEMCTLSANIQNEKPPKHVNGTCLCPCKTVLRVKVQSKVPVHPMKAYRESRGIAPLILNLGTR